MDAHRQQGENLSQKSALMYCKIFSEDTLRPNPVKVRSKFPVLLLGCGRTTTENKQLDFESVEGTSLLE